MHIFGQKCFYHLGIRDEDAFCKKATSPHFSRPNLLTIIQFKGILNANSLKVINK